MKKVVFLVALALGLGMTKVHAQVEQAEPVQAKIQKEQGVVGKIFYDMRESTRTVHEINKQSLAIQQERLKEWYDEATELDPGFVKFREAKGLKSKIAVVAENFRENCKETSEKEKERRGQVKSFDSYRTVCNSLYTSNDVAGLINQTISLGLGYRF